MAFMRAAFFITFCVLPLHFILGAQYGIDDALTDTQASREFMDPEGQVLAALSAKINRRLIIDRK